VEIHEGASFFAIHSKSLLRSNAGYSLITMPAKYQVFKDVEGKYRFRLKAGNNEIIAVSEAYEQNASCLNGIKSMQRNCSAEIEDTTVAGEKISNPKYQVFYDESSGYRFHLTARNGEVIAASEGYKTKEGCLKGIGAIKESCDAEIEEISSQKEQPDANESVPASKQSAAKSIPVNKTETGPSMPKNEPLKNAERSGIVYIGNKMPMDYVLAIITGLSSGSSKQITLKARGKSIATAVDAAEIARRRFLKDLKVQKIAIGTEEMPPKEGENRARMVSTIEIVLSKE
jgi:hypothetical protein